jgi:nitroreductase
VRKYKTDALSAEQIELLMKAGMAAPSGCNAQPWEFIVVQERENLLKITQIHPFSQMLKTAPF